VKGPLVGFGQSILLHLKKQTFDMRGVLVKHLTIQHQFMLSDRMRRTILRHRIKQAEIIEFADDFSSLSNKLLRLSAYGIPLGQFRFGKTSGVTLLAE
jgi:hypothetical protein